MRRLLSVVLLATGVVLLLGGAWVLLNDGRSTSGDATIVENALRPRDTAPPAAALPATTLPPSTTSTTVPPVGHEAIETPAVVKTPAVAPPVGLRIESLGVDARVGASGVDQDTGQMEVPDNVAEVGWYKFGPSPGEPGSAVLAAHVDLAGFGPGAFYELDSLAAGDRISVIHDDGSASTFRVVAQVMYDKDELPLDVIFSREGPPVLTLITCGGGFNSKISRYDSNVVVYAVPEPGTEPSERSTL